jgi:hypothetical protein
LIDIKLNGTNNEEFAIAGGTSSNAVRQKMKRLLAKLRRIAKGVQAKPYALDSSLEADERSASSTSTKVSSFGICEDDPPIFDSSTTGSRP